jgi:SAM-dependent methyltransferase
MRQNLIPLRDMDPETYRAESIERWAGVATGWGAQRDLMRRATEPVATWLVAALHLEPGHTVVEVAAGPGDTGLLAVERVLPGGRLIATDAAEGMVELVAERAGELGFEDSVEPRVMQAEWLDLPTASADAVLCRWGLMLLADPGAALREARRVLRPGGRIALAVWDGPEHNRWASVIGAEMVRRGLFDPPEPGAPGQFAWADTALISEQLEDAGFVDPQVETIDFPFRYDDLDAWWDTQLDLAPTLAQTVAAMSPAERDDLRDAFDAQLREFVRDDGSVELPARTHVASADA